MKDKEALETVTSQFFWFRYLHQSERNFQARLEYDVYRNEVASLQHSGANPEAVAEAESRCNRHRERYEQLKADVKVSFLCFWRHRIMFVRPHVFSPAMTSFP